MNVTNETRLVDLEPALRPVLKILQQNGERLAIRLEKIFWSQLAEIAKERGTKTSQVVFEALSHVQSNVNKTSYLRCFCMDSLRRKQNPMQALANQSFDMMAIVAACPSPVAIMTIERKLVAINPAFSDLAGRLRLASSVGQRAINMSFSESLPKIVSGLIKQPQNIQTYQVGIQIGESPARQFPARFALADRNKGTESLIVIYLLGSQP